MNEGPNSDKMDDEAEAGFRPLGRAELLGIFGFWTFIALLASANQVVDPRGSGTGWAGAGDPITVEFLEAYLWAFLTPPIFWLSARLRIDRRHWVGPAVVLVVAGIGCAVLADVAEDVFEVRALGLPDEAPGTSPVQSLLRLWFLNDLMIFIAVLAAGFAREYFVRYQARQDQAVRLQARAAVLETQLAEAKLEALRMQMNPHFLFNTLHAVSTLVDRDPDGVRRMIAKLGSLLRTTLRGGTEPEVPLERELDFLEDYLEIMQVRFQGRLEVDFDVDPGLLPARVPNLILQPLVENAVKHGVGEVEGPARISVEATAEDGTLVLRVLDTGPGPTDPGTAPEEAGIGLRNVCERLAQLYGGEAELRLEPRPQGGACAEVRLPLRLERAPTPHPAPVAAAGELS